jgi:hypothetical protein
MQLPVVTDFKVPLPDHGFREMIARYRPLTALRDAHRTDRGVP